MRLLFVRHGETDWNRQGLIQGAVDTELNENGLRQAEELAAHLAEEEIQPIALYSSPMKRAVQTAEVLGNAFSLSNMPKNGLREISFGIWEGMTWDRVEREYPEEYRAWEEERPYAHAPEGENYLELLARVLPELGGILKAHEDAPEGSDVLVVIHSAVLLAILCFVYQVDYRTMHQRFQIRNGEAVSISAKELKRRLTEDNALC